jgi:flagellar biosynthesis anti-sigma factor FlgM
LEKKMKRVGNSAALDAYRQMVTPVRHAGTTAPYGATEPSTNDSTPQTTSGATTATERAPETAPETGDAARTCPSSDVRELSTLPAASSPVDIAKVNALRAAIKAGTLELDPIVIAERLIDDLL